MTIAGARIWDALDRLLEGADVAGIRAHKLGPAAARRLRRLGQPVPALLAHDDRTAAAEMLAAPPLLERIRTLVDGPLVLIKGAEVAHLYRDHARSFSDVDLLSPDPPRAQQALIDSGFVEVDDPELFVDHHHLRPLKWPLLPLKVEIHSAPPWPHRFSPPALPEIFEAAQPSLVDVDGILAPAPAHHALILAAHHWTTQPLHRVRDLLDVAVVGGKAREDELEATARAWRIERIWAATSGAAAALLDGGRPTAALRLWARHLPDLRERTVLDNHLLRWFYGFWELPPEAALAVTVEALQLELLPRPGEPWRQKLTRVASAVRRPSAPLSVHTAGWSAAVGAVNGQPSVPVDLSTTCAVVLNWNLPASTIRCVRTLEADGLPSDRVVVVDNGSSDDSLERLRRELPAAHVLALGENAGFARGANLGAAAALAARSYVFVNNDTFVHRPGSLARLVAGLDRPGIGIAVPRLFNEDLSLQPNVVPLPTPANSLLRASGLSRLVPNRWQPRWSTYWDHSRSRVVDSANGAVLAIRASLWTKLGGYTERSWMFSEDLDLCWRARKLGFATWFEDGAEFVHVGNASGQRRFGAEERAEMIGKAVAKTVRAELPPLPAAFVTDVFRLGLLARSLAFHLAGRNEAARVALATARGYAAARSGKSA